MTDATTIRPARPGDLDAVTALFRARDVARYGRPELTAEELAHDWGQEGFDLAADAWVAEAGDGTLLAYADLYPDKPGTWYAEVALRPGPDLDAVETALRARIAGRAAAIATAEGRPELRLRTWLPEMEQARMRRLEAAGWTRARTFLLMRLEPDAPTPPAVWPEGVRGASLRPGVDAEVVHALLVEAFADHVDIGGPAPFDEWRRDVLEAPWFDADCCAVAWDGNRAVGAVIAFPEAGYGWIKQVGVVRAARSRGIAAALLAEAIARLRAKGCAAVELGVDADSPTGATRLYERAGMDLVRRVDVLETHVPADRGRAAPSY